jgi:hypothetical protein
LRRCNRTGARDDARRQEDVRKHFHRGDFHRCAVATSD